MKSNIVIKFSLLVAFFTLIITTILLYVLKISTTNLVSFVFAITIFISSFFISFWLIRILIQQKIKIIYDSINSSGQFKLSKNTDFTNVEKDVLDWENKRQKEIAQLKEIEKYRKEFIGNLAHELKTPVFSVQGYILTLLEGGLEDETINRKFLKKASKGIERIASVIEDMDTITRIESGTLELVYKRFNIINVIRNVFEELEDVAIQKNISLSIKNNSEAYVLADESKITQVLFNLILNSIHYGNKKGSTVVSITIVKEKILVNITDNGLGIDSKHLSRLFERFYRVEKSRVRNKGGSGIGLAIVKHIIEAHKETITVKSEIDKGTSFVFTLKKA